MIKLLKFSPLLFSFMISPASGLDISSPTITEHADMGGLANDEHTQYQKESEKDGANGYAGLDGSGDIALGALPNHASNHTDATDDIQDATAGQKGLATPTQITKLDGIETSATADQTAGEIKTAYESNANTNEFDDTEQSKLAGIETAATADQTNAEIKTAYEANANTNEFDDTEQTKLAGIETAATIDQTGAEIKIAYEGEANTNAFTDSEQTKLTGIESSATADQTNAEIKTAYEANANTNEFSDAEQTKLSNAAELPITRADHDVGTDGEIPTWDAAGNPSKVAVGTANQVLTSNGVGAAPTFQDSAGAATQEFWVFPQSSVTQTNLGNWRSISINALSEVFFTILIPADFTSLVAVVVVFIPDAVETVTFDLFASVAGIGEVQNADDRSSLNETLVIGAGDDNKLTELDVSSVFTALVAGNIVGFKLESDTSNMRILGARFKYN